MSATRHRTIAEGDATAATSLREGLYHRSLAGVDAAVALVVSFLLLAGEANPPWWILAVVAPMLVLVNKLAGLYERDDLVLNKTTLDEAPSLLQSSALFTFACWLLLDGASVIELDATAVTVTWIGTSLLLLVGRGVARTAVGRLTPRERCLLVGEAGSVAALRHKLGASRLRVAVVAALELDRFGHLPGADVDEALRHVVQEQAVDRVIVAPASAGSGETLDLIRCAKHMGVRISVVPSLMEVVGSSVEFDHVEGLTMLGVRRFGLSRSSRVVKRAFDLAGTTVMLVAAAPVMLAIAALIKLDTRGPVFFRQTRVGKDGRHFPMLKFRSMVEGADARKDELRHLNQTDGVFKLLDDPRVTRVGRFLRRTSLDELPQLLNVWRGEMSLVGPRPLVVDEDSKVQGYHRQRLHLTPGMTGHWQILGTVRVPLQEMVGIDYLYIANWSLWTDVKILLRTVPHVFGSRGL